MSVIEEKKRGDVEGDRDGRFLQRKDAFPHHFTADDVNQSASSKGHVHGKVLPFV